ncbi:MAG: hypothetical protein LQ352_005034 [Teloschistes flavicans]|nr:MAG: hypothetical protein LQ352_005034 [Teloschistes flavicans]
MVEEYQRFAYSSPSITPDEFKEAMDEVGQRLERIETTTDPMNFQAQDLMGIKRRVDTKEESQTFGTRNFSRDVLKVEISGPNRSYFSILDVPGVFQSRTQELTKKDRSTVKDMVGAYMLPKESIIICVASGTNDLANQAAFEMASKYDAHLERTVGVITKCDIVQNPSENEIKTLHHGWFVVRNRTPSEVKSGISSLERHEKEQAFFNHSPWTELPTSRRGAHALKRFLADLLCDRIKGTFPTLLTTIQARQEATQRELDKLGSPRSTVAEKRSYLTKLAQHFHDVCSQMLGGRYHEFRNDGLKLRKFVWEANDAFAAEMIHHGHCVPFQAAPSSLYSRSETALKIPTSGAPLTSATSNGPLGEHSGGGLFGSGLSATPRAKAAESHVGSQAPSTREHQFRTSLLPNELHSSYIQNLGTKEPWCHYSFEELRLRDYFQNSSTTINAGFGGFGSSFGQGAPSRSANTTTEPFLSDGPVSSTSRSRSIFDTSHESIQNSSQIYRWIREEIRNCRGTELQGTLNPDVLPALFHRQTARWRELGISHFRSVTAITDRVLREIVDTNCKDTFTARKLKTLVEKSNKQGEARGLLRLQQHADKIASRHLQTHTPSFEENVRNARLVRFGAALKRFKEKRPYTMPQQGQQTATAADLQNQIIIDMRDITSLFDEMHMSNTRNLEDEIHDILKAYYEPELHHFIHHVTDQVVEDYLSDSRGPVLHFNPTYVGSLTDDEIKELGAEDEGVAKSRAQQQATLDRLGCAEEIALRCL